MSTEQPTASRLERIEALLDAALDKVAVQIESGPVSSALLREIVALAKSCDIEIGKDGQGSSAGTDHILESMKDLDLDALMQ